VGGCAQTFFHPSSALHGYRESIIIFLIAIRSFGNPATADLYHGRNTSHARRFPKSILPHALRKLDVLNAVYKLDDLRSPPGNHLEALKGNLEGYHSIRINDQWRITFRWNDGAEEVSLVDYHSRS
jgi:proteic killer suppression protein